MTDVAYVPPKSGQAAARKPANPKEPKPQELVTARVSARRRLSPTFARVTLADEGLDRFEDKGYDQWFRMFFARDGQGRMSLPEQHHDLGWYRQYLAAPDEQRTWMRYVTVSDFRVGAHGPELDVDVVVHGQPGAADCGPLSAWAQSVTPGERVGLLDQGPLFKPDQARAGVVLIGDETAVPGILRILRCLPADAWGEAYLEVPSRADEQAVLAPTGVRVRWLVREDPQSRPAHAALTAATPELLARRHGYVYAAGESTMTKALSELLADQLEWPRERFTSVGYWHDSSR